MKHVRVLQRGILAAVLLTAVLQVPARAQAPETISYQGILVGTDGMPQADGVYDLTFRLYDAADAETALWEETRSVEVEAGLFSTRLGAVTPHQLLFKPEQLILQTQRHLFLFVRGMVLHASHLMGQTLDDCRQIS